MLNSIEDPHCPNCRYGWTRQFVLQNITKTFLDHEWASHRRQILWQREQAYLPDSQVHAERVLQSRRMAEELKPLQAQYDEMLARLRELKDLINPKKPIISALESGKVPEELLQTTDPYDKLLVQEKRQFTHHCPTPNCRGYLDKEFKCGLCRSVSSETLPSSQCTACSATVYKDNYCTRCLTCKTHFNWDTGKSESASIESPYLFEYMTLHKPDLLPTYTPTLNTNTNIRVYEKIPDPLFYYTRSDRTRFETTLEKQQAHNIRGGIYCIKTYLLGDAYKSYLASANKLRQQFFLHDIDQSSMMDAIMNNVIMNNYVNTISDISKTFIHITLNIFERCELAVAAALKADTTLAAFANTDNMYLPERFWREHTKSAWKIHKIWRNVWNNFYPEFTTLREYTNNVFRATGTDFNLSTFIYIDEFYNINNAYSNSTYLDPIHPAPSKTQSKSRMSAAKRVSKKPIPEGAELEADTGASAGAGPIGPTGAGPTDTDQE